MNHQNRQEAAFYRTANVKIAPWNQGVRGTQVLPIINLDDDTIRVEAGPGTGKTFGLARRVQRILHPQGLNVPGNEVLVVAFNRAIAKQLQKDIRECLAGSPHSGEPVIRTIHALCLEIIGSHLRILLPHEVEAMIYDVLCEHQSIRQKYIRHNKAFQALRDHEAKHSQDMQLWQAVQQWLTRHRAQLISELPALLLDKLHGGDCDGHVYRHVIVDEFQDLTAAEQKLFLELRAENGSFMALGDPRQSIYAFRGNDRQGLYKIDELVNGAGGAVKPVAMTECHRCPKEVVHAANQLMGLYEAEPMLPASDVVANTHVVVWRSLSAEAKGMARAIIDNILANPQDDHLVMVTRRQFGYWLREEITNIDATLSIEIGFSEGLLETWAVREAFLYFCLLADSDAPTWRAWLGYQNSHNGKGFKAASRNADAYLRLLTSCDDEITKAIVREVAASPTRPPGNGGSKLWERAKRFVDLKEQLQWSTGDPLELLDEVFDVAKWAGDQSADYETARLDMELILSKARDICESKDMADEESVLTPQQKLQKVAERLRYQIATSEPFESEGAADLRITTLWGAKGVTADHVYVIGLSAEAIPGSRRDEYPGTDRDFVEEQRRLFYVSMTRSKKTLVLSRARSITRGEAARLGLHASQGNPHRPRLEMSPYLRDIIDFLPRAEGGEEWLGVVGR